MFPGIASSHFRKNQNVGGVATWPPTSRLRAAYSSAYAAAYVAPHRRAVSIFIGPIRPKPRFGKIGRKAPGKEFRHARAVFG
jgi:hypothetical protein